jgi:excisionase family DNA binding protein
MSSGFEPQLGRSVSIDEGATFLGVSRRQIYYLLCSHQLETIRTIGGSQRIVRQSLIDWLARRALTRSTGARRLAEANREHTSNSDRSKEEGGAMKIRSQIIGGGVGWTG